MNKLACKSEYSRVLLFASTLPVQVQSNNFIRNGVIQVKRPILMNVGNTPATFMLRWRLKSFANNGYRHKTRCVYYFTKLFGARNVRKGLGCAVGVDEVYAPIIAAAYRFHQSLIKSAAKVRFVDRTVFRFELVS